MNTTYAAIRRYLNLCGCLTYPLPFCFVAIHPKRGTFAVKWGRATTPEELQFKAAWEKWCPYIEEDTEDLAVLGIFMGGEK